MLTVLDFARLVVPLATGIGVGYLLRMKRSLSLNKLVSGTILVLIFSLGFAMGANGDLLSALPNVGLTSIMLLTMALFFSILFVKAARKLVKI